jgi:3'(2'), 5'-bisphosphate nucleotidase
VHAHDARSLADGLLGVALAAARLQMGHFARGVRAEHKPDLSPVTAADRESEAVILAGLAQIAPGVAVVAEEQCAASGTPTVPGTFFLVDPLDGTKGFIGGRTDFTINIALVIDGRPVFGLLYAPAQADFSVTLGPDLAVNAHLDPRSDVRCLADCALRSIKTRVPDLKRLRALTSHTHNNAATQQFLDSHGVVERRALASSLKFALLARGEADLYPRLGPTSEWDTAAGHAVLVAAGGSVTTLDGAALLYGHAERGFANGAFVAWGKGPLPRSGSGPPR